jgi:hypothetical protein
MTKHRTSQARPLRALAALAAALGILAATSLAAAAPASAVDGPHCKHDQFSNACLTFDGSRAGRGWDAYVGIDVYMSEQYAREVLACDENFRASLWGDDGARGPSSDDDHIRDLDIQPGWPRADSTGIAVEFISRDIDTSELDEDDGDDQIYARVAFDDCNKGERRNYITGYSVFYY